MPAPVSAEQCLRRAGQIAAVGQEQPQLERGIGMSEPISAAERIDDWSRLARLREHLGEPEHTRACTSIVGQVWRWRGVSPLGRRVRDRLVDRLAGAISTSRWRRQTTLVASASVP